ncbi:sulfotransferase family protein [Vibrio echinoideorum]|uniref:sulfotransferase family protein n=1 Tax=Vibrio echinoideorum TaxID=2100116 RepID=UPI00108020D9|nr:hypothetical protein [Vibrio echinoideorum]
MSTVYVVLGMHRSGTSLITKSLELFDIDLGQELMPSSPDNQKGYFEDENIVSINTRLMANSGCFWFQSDMEIIPTDYYYSLKNEAIDVLRKKIDKSDNIAIKDPRMILTLPFWKEVFFALNLDVKYILSTRTITSTVDSLIKRDLFSKNFSLDLTLRSLYKQLNQVMYENHVFISYDLLLSDPMFELEKLGDFIGKPAKPDVLNDYCSGFIDRSSDHSKGWSIDEINKYSLEKILELLSNKNININMVLDELKIVIDKNELVYKYSSIEYELHATKVYISRFYPDYFDKIDEIEEIKSNNKALVIDLNEKILSYKEMLKENEAEYENIVNSVSWKLMKPLRFIDSLIGTIFNK